MMEYRHILFSLLLHLVRSTDGPQNLALHGPDYVTVGVPFSFKCYADCLPDCHFTISIDEQRGERKEVGFILNQWVSSKMVICTVEDTATKKSFSVQKTIRVLEGPVNVSISGPHNVSASETQRFLCNATCRPFCTFTWVVNGDSVDGSGHEVVFKPPLDATSGTLICKATNDVSGLFATAEHKLTITSMARSVGVLPALLIGCMILVWVS